MIETLYKTKVLQPTPWRQEFFELSLGEQTVDGQAGYFVRETQCWWDGITKRTLRVQYTLSPREGFAAIEEAEARYQVQRVNRAQRGFVHSFTPRYDSTKKYKYVLIETAPEPAAKPETAVQAGDLALRAEWVEARSLALDKGYGLAERVGNDQDVGEQDRSGETEAVDGLQCHLGSKGGRIAKLEEAADRRTHSTIFRQIATGLTHQPERRWRQGLALEHVQEAGRLGSVRACHTTFQFKHSESKGCY